TTYRNLLTVFLLVGFWHGAAWQFVAWGAYNGLFLIFERIAPRGRWGKPASEEPPPIAAILSRFIYCVPVVLIGWVLFRAAVLPHGVDMPRAIFSPRARDAFGMPDTVVTAIAPPLHLIALGVGSLVFLMPAKLSLGRTLSRLSPTVSGEIVALAYTAACCLVAGMLVLPGG